MLLEGQSEAAEERRRWQASLVVAQLNLMGKSLKRALTVDEFLGLKTAKRSRRGRASADMGEAEIETAVKQMLEKANRREKKKGK